MSWAGCYAGLHAGGLWGSVDHKVIGTSTSSYQRDVTFSSFTAGAHGGCNYHAGSLVLGVEGDLNWTAVDDNVLAYSNDTTTQRWRDRFDWYGTIRGRVGVAADNWHAYVTAGRAYADLNLSIERFENGFLTSRYASASSSGWVAGGGFELAVQPQWILRLEYLYHQFGSRLILNEGNQFFFRADEPHFHVVRVGIMRRFGM